MCNHAAGIIGILKMKCLYTANEVKLETAKEVHLSFRMRAGSSVNNARKNPLSLTVHSSGAFSKISSRFSQNFHEQTLSKQGMTMRQSYLEWSLLCR